MNKKDLVKELSEMMDVSQKDCSSFLNCLSVVITGKLQTNDSVKLTNIGRIYPYQQISRPGRNPKTGEFCPVPERISTKFKPSKYLIEALNTKTGGVKNEKD